MTAVEIGSDDETYAYLIAGRSLYGVFTGQDMAELRNRVGELAAEIGEPLVPVWPVTRVTRPGGYIGECVLGVLVARADTAEFEAVSYTALAAELARARALPWERISERVLPDRGEASLSDTGMYATARGAVAGVHVAYGVLVALREEDAEPDWEVDEEQQFRDDPASPAATVPGLDLVRGNMMDQTPQPDAVYGVAVARALYDDPPPVVVDISDVAHKERVTRLGELAAQSSYYLVAHHD